MKPVSIKIKIWIIRNSFISFIFPAKKRTAITAFAKTAIRIKNGRKAISEKDAPSCISLIKL